MRDLDEDERGRPAQRTAEMRVAGGEGPPWIVVTAESHPALFRALQMISHDSGFGANHDNFSLEAAWEPRLAAVERGLATLSPEDLETFAIGEYEAGRRIGCRSADLTQADALLVDFFGEG